MVLRLSTLALTAALLWVCSALAGDSTGFIDQETARDLALEAVRPSLPHVDMHALAEAGASLFFLFDGEDANRSVGHYAVNPWTGDVWSTAGRCRLLTSHGLRRRQAEIRKKYRRQAGKHWVEWKKLKPGCNTD